MNTPSSDNGLAASNIRTKLEWADLVLADKVLTQIDQIYNRIKGAPAAQSNPVTGAKVQTGLRVLFTGQPGTGKTTTACVLGKSAGHEVYRVDLSAAASKYKSEIEDNLSQVFAMADDRRWILYFDCTEALFGKKVAAGTPGDDHAGPQIASLLQHLQTHPGPVIMSTALPGNPDEYLLQLFDFTVNFPVPDAAQRLRLWQSAFAGHISTDVNLPDIATAYEVTGGDIMNVLRYCSLNMAKDGSQLITLAAIEKGLREELHK